jgi:hypothetical protein
MVRVLNALFESGYWGFIPIPYPKTPEAGAITAVALLVILLLMFLAGLANTKKGRFKVRWEGHNKDASIVEMRLETAKNFWPARYRHSHTGDGEPILLAIRGQKRLVRLSLNQSVEPETLKMDGLLAENFGLKTIATENAGELADIKVKMRPPLWRVDLRTWKHPNPDIQLQWRMGLIFLALGIVIPKLLEVIL